MSVRDVISIRPSLIFIAKYIAKVPASVKFWKA